MSGYGSPDDEATHALILAENGVHRSQMLLAGPVQNDCLDCGRAIAPARVSLLRNKGMKCVYCIECQPKHDAGSPTKMLQYML